MKYMTDQFIQAILYCRKNPLEIVILLIFLIAILKITSLYMGVESDADNWDQFKAEHHCIAHIENPEIKISSWKCDDGEIYYNWRQMR